MIMTPCKDCNRRTIDCHCHCQDYKAYKEQMQIAHDNRVEWQNQYSIMRRTFQDFDTKIHRRKK